MTESPQQRNDRQMLEARQASGKKLDQELRRIEDMVDPAPSFVRGIQVGALSVTALNTMAPGMFGVAEWPQPIRITIGLLFIVATAHFLIRQRGFMIAQRMNRSVQP